MKLWTYQDASFDLTADRCDLSKSRFKDRSKILSAYKQLATLLGQDEYNVVWCVGRPEPENWAGNREWQLEVADWKGIVDQYVWGRTIEETGISETLWNKWRDEAIDVGANTMEYCEKKRVEYLSRPEPEDGWWSQLFINDPAADEANILLQPPICESFVVRKTAV